MVTLNKLTAMQPIAIWCALHSNTTEQSGQQSWAEWKSYSQLILPAFVLAQLHEVLGWCSSWWVRFMPPSCAVKCQCTLVLYVLWSVLGIEHIFSHQNVHPHRMTLGAVHWFMKDWESKWVRLTECAVNMRATRGPQGTICNAKVSVRVQYEECKK